MLHVVERTDAHVHGPRAPADKAGHTQTGGGVAGHASTQEDPLLAGSVHHTYYKLRQRFYFVGAYDVAYVRLMVKHVCSRRQGGGDGPQGPAQPGPYLHTGHRRGRDTKTRIWGTVIGSFVRKTPRSPKTDRTRRTRERVHQPRCQRRARQARHMRLRRRHSGSGRGTICCFSFSTFPYCNSPHMKFEVRERPPQSLVLGIVATRGVWSD